MKRRAALQSGSLGAALALAGGLALGCSSNTTTTPGGPPGGSGDGPEISGFTVASIEAIDLLLMIDNSRSMADKQKVLAATIPDLVRGLANPACVDGSGTPAAAQPEGPTDACPEPGTHRRFLPIRDIHIGVITSSIGGHGSDACPASETYSCPGGAVNRSNDDAAHLVTRQDPCAGGSVSTYADKGFLAWDPAGAASPPGEAALGAVTFDPATGEVTTAQAGLLGSLEDLVLGAGQIGCGYEASMESWYRFLVDPEPYDTLVVDASTGKVAAQGLDTTLLQQRKDFLRPNSLLLVIGLSDENDCSIKESGQFYFAAQQRDPENPNKNFQLPRARSECAVDPTDPCCRSCGQAQGACPPDPACDDPTLAAADDDVNLRCWDQKRRFGIDFLYPIDRYVTGLTESVVPNRSGELVPNPIFSDPDQKGGSRNPSMVLFTYIVGVPWQDLARDPLDPKKGFKTTPELEALDGSGPSGWEKILGNPALQIPPLDPHMIESTAPRATLPPPAMTEGGPDPVSGHEYTPGTSDGVQKVADDLQYACIFPLPAARDCQDPQSTSCDCADPLNDNPLCAAGPAGRTIQTHAKAYPGIRQLAFIRALGSRGIAGSICPPQLTAPGALDFGYRPALANIFGRFDEHVDGLCAARSLNAGPSGRVDCTVVEAQRTGQHLDAAACAARCAAQPGRAALSPAMDALRMRVLADPATVAAGADCVCEIPQLAGPVSPGCLQVSSPLAACQCDPADTPTFAGQTVDGWCYVDAGLSPPLGSADIVAHCPPDRPRELRFTGAGAPISGSIAFVACGL